MDLLDEAVDRARTVVAEKCPQLASEELEDRAKQVGIGAVKYADLSTSRTRDYIFDADCMVSPNGDTGIYLQYAYARIQSILRKAPDGVTPIAHQDLALEPAERALGLLLDEFGATIVLVTETFEPHRLCAYLHSLAAAYTVFYEHCPVLMASSGEVMETRLLLCQLTGRTLRQGMDLHGIGTSERL